MAEINQEFEHKDDRDSRTWDDARIRITDKRHLKLKEDMVEPAVDIVRLEHGESVIAVVEDLPIEQETSTEY
ncbi:hypothetical protein TorRG33x02_246250 [Trema orientale]|uniref:Uncharacterized protein n=1 Tax=Trema orientale TaxID=63057 RepID=A0A2P5DNJ4_TREOI|nr:hypothetical protein TorRG33x02_246250 [Trema orientale]